LTLELADLIAFLGASDGLLEVAKVFLGFCQFLEIKHPVARNP